MMRFSWREVRDLVIAWIVISLVFVIAFGITPESILFAAIGVGVAFICHELAHKYTAQKYGLQAYFKSFNMGLLISFILSFFGIILIAPGAVVIPGMRDKIRAGRISLAGPVANLALAGLSLLLYLAFPNMLFVFSAYINGFLAFFNLLPVSVLDGKKVFDWNKRVYAVVMTLAVISVIVSLALQQSF